MTTCTKFRLNIWRTGLDCTFQLTWDEGKQISTTLKYPVELTQLYEDWQQSYLKAYESPLRGRAEENFSFTPSSIDWKNNLEEIEKAFLLKFNRWLAGKELLKIRERIQKEVVKKLPSKTQKITSNSCVDLLIACDSMDLVRLPWEAWEIGAKDSMFTKVRISRTLMNVEDEVVTSETIERRGQVRILVILATASELNLLEDQRAVRSLSKVAKVELLKLQPEQKNFREEITNTIEDERGWDVLIFAGHSNETALTGGRLELAPNVCLSMSEIEPALIKAKNRGLKAAIFNSCNGLSIAEFLIQLGLNQVVVMRERIHDLAAHTFLKLFCQHLARYKDIYEAVAEACQYFKSEKNAYPSAYLIPSLFRHPSPKAELFRIEPFGLKRIWRDWKPSRREAIVLASVLLLSAMVPVQDLLFDLRTLTQAVYRNKTGQIPQTTPPVRLISIDQESINRAIEKLENFKLKPMNREYLAEIIKQLSDLNVKTIGIDYELYTQEPKQEKLTKSIQSAVSQKNTFFVFAVNEFKKQKVFTQIANPNWSLQGDISFLPWDVELPDEKNCAKICPFAYLLALSYKLNQIPTDNVPQPSLSSKRNFQKQISDFLNQKPNHNKIISSLNQAYSPFGWRSIIDFSIPPNNVYEQIPAWQLLEFGSPHPELMSRIQQQVAIIASGGYEEAEDNFSVPLAIDYWCTTQGKKEKTEKTCLNVFTGGEVHAYMVHHLLLQHRVTLIPDFWLIFLAVIMGKWSTIIIIKQTRNNQRKISFLLLGAMGFFIVISLQVYISASILIPWLLPSVVFLNYTLPFVWKKSYA